MTTSFTLAEIEAAAMRIAPWILHPPLLVRGGLLLKPESLQDTGAFKIRGAFSLMTTLPSDCPGVVCHSSGNHAQAVARAARLLGLRAVAVMPDDAPPVKRARVEADGAEIVTVGPDSEERRQVAIQLSQEQGLALVPAYDHPLVALGQGTAALEALHEADPVDRLICPVSGGGLMAGCATAVSALCPDAEIVAVETVDGDDLRRSLEAGERVAVPPPTTIADGCRVRIPGEHTWPVLQRLVDRVALVEDEEILDAMAWALRELRLVLEPSGAMALAAALRERPPGRSLVILSGGNVQPELLARALAR